GIVFYPRRHCTHCLSQKLSWKTSKGEGTVYTYSVVRQNRQPAFKSLGAYAIAFVDLDEGFRILTNIVGVADPTKDIQIGQRVRVDWEDYDSVSLPVFRLQ
ncbi:MAG: Zn-ribbon domain-containing OB-fold protein, partial [Dehalococcoidia bacterium]